MKATDRLYYVDYLKVVITMLVIAHHVGQAYGPTGGWWPILEENGSAVLGSFFTVNRSFFMSLFFMLAGYFTVIAVQSKGAKAFLKDRALRLGIPVLIFGLVMIPMQMFVFAPEMVGEISDKGWLPLVGGWCCSDNFLVYLRPGAGGAVSGHGQNRKNLVSGVGDLIMLWHVYWFYGLIPR